MRVFRAGVTAGENKQNMKGRAPPFPAYQLLTICLETFFNQCLQMWGTASAKIRTALILQLPYS